MDNTGHESTKPAHGEPSASVAAATMNNIEPAQELTGNESRSAGPGHVESATLDNIEPAPQLAGNGSESASLGHVESTAPTLDVTMGDIDSASEPTDKESALSQETGQTTPHETTNSLPTASDTAASEAAASTAAIVKADEPAAAGPSTISAPSMANDTGSIFNDASSFGTPSSFSIPLSVDDSDDNTDGDSALGSVLPNSSMSATSSVFNFVEEFGRTFHKYKEGKYFLPNDEQEINRLDLQHRIALQVLDWKLYLAPIDRPNRVLDLGTGTGIWAIEFADQNPECDVLGTDLSPIQPEYVPANCRFEIDDAEDEWVFTYKFDYIHGRYMCAFLTDFPKLFTTIYDNLNPGGWVEFMETLIYFQSQDGTLEGTSLQRWNRLLLEGIRNLGRNAQSCMRYKRWMEEAGFRNVEERKFIVPATPWAKGRKNKELGALQMVNNLNGVYGLTMTVFTKGLNWTAEEVEVFLAEVRSDMSNRNIHAYITIMCIFGQKPA